MSAPSSLWKTGYRHGKEGRLRYCHRSGKAYDSAINDRMYREGYARGEAEREARASQKNAHPGS